MALATAGPGPTGPIVRIRLEFWIAEGYAALEPEAFAYPTFSVPASGPIPASTATCPVKFTPSPSLATALLTEAQAAINAVNK